MKKGRKMASLLLSFGLMLTFATSALAADTQVFADGNKLSNVINQDGRVYVQLREIAHYTGYEIEYKQADNTVSYYQSGTEKPEITRISNLYPSAVDEQDLGDRREIMKVYELVSGDDPFDIPKEDFEKDGFKFTLTDITRQAAQSVDVREHSEVITVETGTNDLQTVLAELQKEIEFTTADGYSGILSLDISSVKSDVAGYNSSSRTTTETREYPNLSNQDVALVPKTINVGGKTMKLATVNWKSETETNIDYSDVPKTYTAVAIYNHTGTYNSIKGYSTTATYTGDVTKVLDGETIYTAYFSGTKIEQAKQPEPEKELTVEELETQLEQAREKEKAEARANGESAFNPLVLLLLMLIVIALLGGLLYLIFLRKNVIVYNLTNDHVFKMIGKARVTKDKPVIDLTGFTSKAALPSFELVIDGFTAKRLKDVNITINYGGKSLQHTVFSTNIISESKPGIANKTGYQFGVDF